MKIEPAADSDAAEIARLVNRAYEVEQFFVLGDRTSPERVREAMRTGTFLALRSDARELVACVYVQARDGRGTFGMLAVDPGEQRRGRGRRLIDAAEEYARRAGCHTMEISVVNLREELFPRYRRLGYVEAGTAEYDHRPTVRDCHFVMMRKVLK